MDDPPPPLEAPDPRASGRITRDEALALVLRGDALLESGDYAEAGQRFSRVVGFDDPAITAAALLGLGEARYRLDDEVGAVQAWMAVLELPETPSTYPAWRNVAAARVRDRDLSGAMDAYREADRRAPEDDKAEIANRLGWLAKETGDTRSSQRYFAKGRGDAPRVTLTLVIIAVTSIVSLTALFSTERDAIYGLLQLDKPGVAVGEYWRLWSVTLLHGDLIHLAFNMYALFLAGSIVERWYGSIRFLAFYLACAAAGSTASFVFGGDVPSVGASGAVFGMFGILLTAGRLHHPVDRQARGIVNQLVFLVIINLVFGFTSGGSIDNAAHLGGLAAGLWLGALIPPTKVPTLSSLWNRPSDGRT
ncbi:MAG: rhomboid family intramembrane serine protease, partial [Thermomicrobiales bacterium]